MSCCLVRPSGLNNTRHNLTQNTMKTKIAIIVEGGNVVAVNSNNPDVEYVVIDHDKPRKKKQNFTNTINNANINFWHKLHKSPVPVQYRYQRLLHHVTGKLLIGFEIEGNGQINLILE